MSKIYIFYLSFVLAVFLSTLAFSQTIVFTDDFDTYTTGQQLACQNPTVWYTWSNTPCSATEDAYISSNYSFGGGNSVVIVNSNDIVKQIGTPISSGIAEINFRVFIPNGKAGYFNTLANFNPPTYAWAMQTFLNANGSGTLDAGGQNAATFTYPQNQWFTIKIVADLTADSGKLWIDETLIHKWQWSKGTFGTSNDKRLDGNDFFGYTANDEMYIDDYNIVQMSYTNKITSTATGGNWTLGSTWVGGFAPGNSDIVEIVQGSTVTLDQNRTRNALTKVNGTLRCLDENRIAGGGEFVLSAGSTIEIGSVEGIAQSVSNGNIRVTGTRYFSPYANYVYNGSNAQVTGDGLPATINNLTVNNSSGLTLSSNTSVSGVLTLGNGNLVTNSNTLSIGTSVSNPGSIVLTSGKVMGNFKRWFSNSVGPNVLFPVGTSSLKYTPVTLNNVVGSGTFSVSAVSGKHPNASGTNVLQMYWKLTNGGITSTDLTFNYLDADVVGDENQYELGRYNGSWAFLSPIILNTVANTVSISGINSFSDWTLGEPAALPVELTSFTASIIGRRPKLIWETETEVNNYGFEVERISEVKGRTSNGWKKVGFVNGNGNSNSPKNYSFIDEEVSSGKFSYRLKQIDNDGKFEYSSIVEIDLGNPTEYSLAQNYPNPFNPNTSITFSLPESGNVKLTVYNLLGQEVKTLVNGFTESGVNTINFSALDVNSGELNSGVYIYKLETNGIVQTRKMTLVK